MKSDIIPEDSTIETIWTRLTHPDAYVRGVLSKLRVCAREHGNASVRIGVTGSGQKPYYRIFYEKTGEAEPVIIGSYYDNHELLEFAFAQTGNWSKRSMTFQAVMDFFAEKTGWQGVKS